MRDQDNDNNEFRLSNEELETIEAEVARWQEYLNLTIGVLAFTLAITIVSLKAKVFWAWLAFVFLLLLVLPNMKWWPPTLNALKRKKDKTKQEEIIYRGLMDKFFGAKALFLNFAAYWFSLTFLGLVGFGVADWIEKTLG
jgi:hypothetical protein